MSAARETLFWHYRHRSAAALAAHQAGVPVVGYTSNTVPWELIRAAGCFPLLLSPDVDKLNEPTPLADVWMEPVFDSRIRSVFDGILADAWPYLKLLIIPRTSEPEYKLYLYLREVARQELSKNVPPLHLYDLLHTRSPISRGYGLARTEELKLRLEVRPEALEKAVDESNRARIALRGLQRLRTERPSKISGTDALRISSAFYFMERGAYTDLVNQVCEDANSAPALEGPRLLMKGMPLHHPGLHQALEAQDAVVIAEDDWWGTRAGGANISGFDVDSVFAKYYLDEPSPRVWPASAADSWFEDTLKAGVDGVVFYLPPDDDVYGWDYPRQRDFVHARGIPSLLIKEDASRDLSVEATAELKRFVEAIKHGG